jgi:hypothetical protein
MSMRFEELDDVTRRYMLEEFEAEEQSGNPYRGKELSPTGRAAFPDLMRLAITTGNEQTLFAALNNSTYWVSSGVSRSKTGRSYSRSVNVAHDAERLGLTEFNTWYVRGLAKRLLDDGEKQCQVYRAAPARLAPDTCSFHEGQILPLDEVYRGHRAKYHPAPGRRSALSVPFGPTCHHTIRRVR